MKKKRKPKQFLRTIARRLFALTMAGTLVGLLGMGGLYVAYSKDLPSDETLKNWRANEATRILDRNGKILYEIYGDEKRVIVPTDKLSPHLKDATVAIEDARFYNHNGVDMIGISRALVANIKRRKTSEGGSTITQQLAKNAYLTTDRTVQRKAKEVFLALRMERHYTKEQILTMYLNEVGYGSNAYGAESASQMYFGKSANDLSLPEAATLAALTKSPTYLSPYGTNTEELVKRRNTVLDRMVDQGLAKAEDAEKAKAEKLAVQPKREQITAPHFAMYVKQQLVDKYGEDTVNKGGLQVMTTLDLDKQRIAEDILKEAAPHLQKSGASNAALVAIDPKTGEILTMVGSRDYFDSKNDGNVNVAVSHRPPGSAFKPIVYAEAFEKGPWSPGSTLFDVETDFGDDKKAYVPKNYDQKFHGPVSIREALANSYNVPAVKMMGVLGKEHTLETAKKVGITTLNDPNRYGLSLVIGGGDIRLVELAGAYGAFANKGMINQPVAITKITQNDKTLFEYKPEPKFAFRPEVAFEINSILSDNEARKIVFGPRSPLYIEGRTVAAKTGTTQDYRDAWTIGYTPSLVTGVWVGNNDFSPMKSGSAGAMAAAPLWNKFMVKVLEGKPNEAFEQPGGLQLVKVDAVTGKLPTSATRQTREDIVAPWQMPSEIELASYRVIGCDGSVREARSTYIVRSEKPDDPRWEKPVAAWARANGYPTSQPRDVRETCEPSPTPQVAEEQSIQEEPPALGGADQPGHIEQVANTPPPIPSPANTAKPVPTPEPEDTPKPARTPKPNDDHDN